MKIRSVFLSMLFIAMLFSCKKEDVSNNNNNTNNNTNSNNNGNDSSDGTAVLRLASVQFDAQPVIQKETFYYNSTGLINKVTSEQWLGQEDSTTSQPYYTVDAEWALDSSLSSIMITMASSQSIHTLQFTKDPVHQMVRSGFYPITLAFGSESLLGFDNKGRIVADSNYVGGNVPISNYKLFTWDANDNLVKIDSYFANSDGSFTNNYSIECTYDQHKNPLYSNTPYFFALGVGDYYEYQGKHNLLQEKITVNGSTTIRNIYTYEYNQQGYPIKRTMMPGYSSGPNIVKFFYQ